MHRSRGRCVGPRAREFGRPSSCNALNQGRIAIGNATRSIRRLFIYVDLLLPHRLSSDRWVSRRSQVWAREVRRALGVGAGFECESEPCEEHRRLHTLVVPWLHTTHEGRVCERRRGGCGKSLGLHASLSRVLSMFWTWRGWPQPAGSRRPLCRRGARDLLE